jgi:hypothetical protein
MSTMEDLRSQPRFEFSVAPERFDPQALDSERMQRVIMASKVESRGWSFPYADERSVIIGPGEKYIGGELSYTTFVNHLEEWRLYSSGQFLLRLRPWEVPDVEWQQKTRFSFERLGRQLPEGLVGFLSFELLLFTITEACIFASRLVQEVPYKTPADLHLGLRSVKGYALGASEPSRRLSEPYMCPLDDPYFDAKVALDVLVADPRGEAIRAVTSLYRQFRWGRPPSFETLAKLQSQYYR